MDKATSPFEKLAFARCFVDITAKKPLAKSLTLEIEGGENVNIEVEHEWVPSTCSKCSVLGMLMSQKRILEAKSNQCC